MLEQIFGSNTRNKLLHLFLENPDKSFFVREITRSIGERINSVRRELDNLEKFGLILCKSEGLKKFYFADKGFILFGELKSLIGKSKILAQRLIALKAKKMDGVKYFSLLGSLVGDEAAPTDILLIGSIASEQLQKLIKELEKAYRQPLRYTHFSVKEYNLRKKMTDKFLYTVLNSNKIELVNRL